MRTSLLLGSYLSRIGRIENTSCSACGHSSQDTSHLIMHCPAMDSLRRSLFGDSVSLGPLVQTLGSCPASGAPWFSAMPPSLGRGRVANNNMKTSRFVALLVKTFPNFRLIATVAFNRIFDSISTLIFFLKLSRLIVSLELLILTTT